MLVAELGAEVYLVTKFTSIISLVNNALIFYMIVFESANMAVYKWFLLNVTVEKTQKIFHVDIPLRSADRLLL